MADIISTADYKAAVGITGTSQDTEIGLAVTRATAAIRSYTGRQFGAAAVSETRTFPYNGSGILEIDDAASIASVSWVNAPGGTNWEARPYTPPYTWLYVWPLGRGGSAEMGFTRNEDNLLEGAAWNGAQAKAQVTASWGYPTVPDDVKQAAVFTVGSWLDSDRGGELAGESIAAYSVQYAVQAAITDFANAIPAKARALLDPYFRDVVL